VYSNFYVFRKQTRNLLGRFVTSLFFTMQSCQPHTQIPRWRTTPCRLTATAYSLYSELPSISEGCLLLSLPTKIKVTHKQTDRKQGDLLSLNLFLQKKKKESSLKRKIINCDHVNCCRESLILTLGKTQSIRKLGNQLVHENELIAKNNFFKGN
jgi:hypothetical protein